MSDIPEARLRYLLSLEAKLASAEAVVEAAGRLADNWPRNRDGMDGEMLPTGIHAFRAALDAHQEVDGGS